MSSVASTEYRLFAEANLSKKDCNGRKLVAIDSLQQGMIKIGAKCIPYLAKLKISPIQNIYTLYVESKKALAKLIPSSTKDRDQEKPNLTIFETDNSVVCKNVKYTLRRGSYFDAIKIIAEQILKGNPSVGKDYIYDSCNITSEAIRAGSIKKWFIASGGDPERFARDGLINSDKKGNCSIPFDKSCIEFVRYSSLPNQNGA